MIKLDIHLNLGQIPTTKKLTPLHVSPQQMIDYIAKYQLTHALILYRDVEEYREVRKGVPENVKLYPLKWIVDVDLDMQSLLTQEPEAVGVCVHSHRGTTNGKEFGLDYAGREVHKVFKKLPNNFIVCVHTQGVNSYRNISRALSVAKWAVKYPQLKFLIEHTGSYVRKEFYPKIHTYQDLTSGHIPAFLQDAIGSESCVNEAILVASKLSNVFLDSSICSTRNYKTLALATQSNRWAFGSDWPFEVDLCPVERQEKVFSKHHSFDEEDLQRVHARGVEFLEASTEELFDKYSIKIVQHGSELPVPELETLGEEQGDEECNPA